MFDDEAIRHPSRGFLELYRGGNKKCDLRGIPEILLATEQRGLQEEEEHLDI